MTQCVVCSICGKKAAAPSYFDHGIPKNWWYRSITDESTGQVLSKNEPVCGACFDHVFPLSIKPPLVVSWTRNWTAIDWIWDRERRSIGTGYGMSRTANSMRGKRRRCSKHDMTFF